MIAALAARGSFAVPAPARRPRKCRCDECRCEVFIAVPVAIGEAVICNRCLRTPLAFHPHPNPLPSRAREQNGDE